MADEEHAPTSRKRVAGTQINKDNPEPDDEAEEETGTFKKASEEVMATRRIVKVRRQQSSSAPSSNPFSAIRFTPSDTSAQASIPVSKSQPSNVTTTNVKDSFSSEKADGGSNGSGKDALSVMGKSTGSSEVAEIQKDELALKEPDVETKSSDPTEAPPQSVGSNDKAKDTGDGSGEDKVVTAEPKEDDSKTSDVKDKTEDADSEQKNIVDEAVDESKLSKDDAGKKDGDESETKGGSSEEQKDADSKGQSSSPAPLFSFKNLSSGQNAFTGLAGTGFSGSSFSFGSASKESSNAPLFGLKTDGSSFPSFNIGASNNGSSSSALATSAEAPKKFAMPEGPVETGEENEKAVFSADSVLYEYLDGGWKERGKGELKLNVPVSGGERSRLVMRVKGNYRLILNASLYEDIALKDMDKKGATFACMNSVGNSQAGLTTVALKFKDTSIREDFKAAVVTHKGKKASDALKTPENSPKASDD